MKILFAPIGIGAGLIAGLLGKKAFEQVWALIDDEEPPEPDQRGAPKAKLIASLAIGGAIFGLAKGLTDHGARRAFASFTGRWPGEDPAHDK